MFRPSRAGWPILAILGGCAPASPAPLQVIDIHMIGPILTEMRREIAVYQARGTVGPHVAMASPAQAPSVSFVLPNPPPVPPATAHDMRAGAPPSPCAAPEPLVVQSATLSLLVSTDRTLTRGLPATLPATLPVTLLGGYGGALSLSPGSTRETISTETLQFTEYPRQSSPTPRA